MTIPCPEVPEYWEAMERVAFKDGFEKGVAAAARAKDEARASAATSGFPRSAAKIVAGTLARQAAKRLGCNQSIERHTSDAVEVVMDLFDHRFPHLDTSRIDLTPDEQRWSTNHPHVVIFGDGSLGYLNQDCDRARRA